MDPVKYFFPVEDFKYGGCFPGTASLIPVKVFKEDAPSPPSKTHLAGLMM